MSFVLAESVSRWDVAVDRIVSLVMAHNSRAHPHIVISASFIYPNISCTRHTLNATSVFTPPPQYRGHINAALGKRLGIIGTLGVTQAAAAWWTARQGGKVQ